MVTIKFIFENNTIYFQVVILSLCKRAIKKETNKCEALQKEKMELYDSANQKFQQIIASVKAKFDGGESGTVCRPSALHVLVNNAGGIRSRTVH